MTSAADDKCGRCGLELGRGGRHPNADACLDAALRALDARTRCAGCGRDLTIGCVSCTTQRVKTGWGIARDAFRRAFKREDQEQEEQR